jgi:hypothetical protein
VRITAKIVAALLWSGLIGITVGCDEVPPPPDWTKNAAGQMPPVLSRIEKEHVAKEVFGRIDRVSDLPKDALQQLGEMADPGESWQVDCVGSGPGRRLIFAAMSGDRLIVYFEQGGIAHSWMIDVFFVAGEKAVLKGHTSASPDIHNVEELKKAVAASKVD